MLLEMDVLDPVEKIWWCYFVLSDSDFDDSDSDLDDSDSEGTLGGEKIVALDRRLKVALNRRKNGGVT